MNRRISTRIEKLEAVWRPPDQEYRSLLVSFWNGTGQPDPYMTISWAPGRPTRTVYHQRPEEAPAAA